MLEIGVAVNSIRAILANAKDVAEILNRISEETKSMLSETEISILSRRFVFAGDAIFDESQVGREFLEGDSWIFNQELKGICAPRCGYISWIEDSGYVVASPIIVSKDSMSAYLVVPPKRTIANPITVSILRDIYMYSGLKREYDGSMENFLISCWERGGVFKISEGVPPTVARNRSFSFLINVITDEEKLRSNFGRVPVVEVCEGEKIAKVTGERESQEGVDVFGNLLAPENVEQQMDNQEEYQVGFGCHIAHDGEYLIASVTGVFVVDSNNKEYSVKDTLFLDMNIDPSYGNIQTRFSNIYVAGSIKGVTIKSGGNLIVTGKVEDAQINSHGKVVVKDGIEGIGRICKVETAESVESKFLSKVLVRSGSYVCIESHIIESEISSEGSIIVLSENGVISHSRLSTSAWIGCQRVGDDQEKNSKSVFRVGFNSKEHEVRMRIDEHIRKLYEEVQRIRSDLGSMFWEDPVGSMRRIPKGQHSDVRKKLADLKKSGNKLLQLQAHRVKMNQQEFNWDEKKSGVAVFSSIFPGVSLYLEKYGPLLLKDKVNGPIYFKIDPNSKEDIVVSPLDFFSSPSDMLPSPVKL